MVVKMRTPHYELNKSIFFLLNIKEEEELFCCTNFDSQKNEFLFIYFNRKSFQFRAFELIIKKKLYYI
jgi:hypothetical protein